MFPDGKIFTIKSTEKGMAIKFDFMKDLVFCEHCKYYDLRNMRCFNKHSPCRERMTPLVWFCADGEQRID